MRRKTNEKRTGRAKGWLVAGLSVAVLLAVVALKAKGDTGGGLDS